ncbi:MAG TPA: hypothetical protein VKZ85_05605 [Woeseiaceae bacterium]|nr:hypothetical protein [Woeseiaceae bacterium]
MKPLKLIGSWAWRLVVAGAGYAAGMVLGGIAATALGLEPPRSPPSDDPAAGAMLLLPGGMALALGLAAMAKGLPGTRWQRWLVLGTFAYVVNGVGTTLELSEFSNLGGGPFSLVLNLPASYLCALLVVALFRASPAAGLADTTSVFSLPPVALAGRLLLAFLAFPVLYFVFGMLVAPIVLPHYEQIDFIIVPPLGTILFLVACRSVLFLLVTVPVIVRWGLSRGRLAVALATGHFAAVGLCGLVQAQWFPPVLRWTHGVEILATSVVYGAVLAWLLFPVPRAPAAAAAAGDA